MVNAGFTSSTRTCTTAASWLRRSRLLVAAACLVLAPGAAASAAHWNVFNIEGEGAVPAVFVTYDTLADMLMDTNRVDIFSPTNIFAANIIGSGSDGRSYWNVFNIEGEGAVPAVFVTYDTLADMLMDTNRVDIFSPTNIFAANIVGSGSDGRSYWNVFNIEGEGAVPAVFVTYDTLADMLMDTNRVDIFSPTNIFAANIIGSGSDGRSYWNVFNIEGEGAVPAVFVTYDTLADMLMDTNRVDIFSPTNIFAANIIGSGAEIVPVVVIPEPNSMVLCGSGLLALAIIRWRRVTRLDMQRQEAAGNA